MPTSVLVAPKFSLFQPIIDPDGNQGVVVGMALGLPWHRNPSWSYFIRYPKGVESCPWLSEGHIEELYEGELKSFDESKRDLPDVVGHS